MTEHGNIDPCLKTLGSLSRYQLLQVLASTIGLVGASYQLMGNMFVGQQFSHSQCSSPDNVTLTSQQSDNITWNSSDVEYGQCEIIVSANNSSVQTYPCLFGHSYNIDRHLSFRTEGVVTSLSTMGIEWFPAHCRSIHMLISSTIWALSTMSMSLVAFLMRHQTWRSLQTALSAVSAPLVLFQLW
ncbi:hypothetical protein ACOMHN_024774 [Nucella lapillus]